MARSSLYQQVAAEVRRAIYSGELGPGAQIPTETELMDAHGVSRNTVRLALGELENEGLILRMRRRGTFVRERRPLLMRPQDELRRPVPRGPRFDSFVHAVTSEGRRADQNIEVSIVQPPEDIITRLAM